MLKLKLIYVSERNPLLSLSRALFVFSLYPTNCLFTSGQPFPALIQSMIPTARPPRKHIQLQPRKSNFRTIWRNTCLVLSFCVPYIQTISYGKRSDCRCIKVIPMANAPDILQFCSKPLILSNAHIHTYTHTPTHMLSGQWQYLYYMYELYVPWNIQTVLVRLVHFTFISSVF